MVTVVGRALGGAFAEADIQDRRAGVSSAARTERAAGDRKRQPGLPERHPAAFFGAVQDRSLFDPVRKRADV